MEEVTAEMETLQIEEESEQMEVEAAENGGLAGEVKCKMNGVVCHPGMDNAIEAEALREIGDAFRNTKIIEDHFDDLGRPRVKIVYVDIGDLTSRRPRADYEVSNHIHTIIKLEKEREEREGTPQPRLIFVKQDRDY